MKKTIWILLLSSPLSTSLLAQEFIDKAMVEYEVKTNIKKTIGSGRWADMMKENLPDFKTGYFQFSFNKNQSVYKFNHWDEKVKFPEFMRRDDELNEYFFDHAAKKFSQKKAIFGAEILVQDSIPKINWRLTNENRLIAGFNCKKAVGIIMDSVYVFAFYTEEIMIPGGPCSINGLPGLVLGATIPRLYTSFIATKVTVNGINTEDIKPVAGKKFNSRAMLTNLITERAKEWSSNDEDEDSKKWREQFVWGALL